MNKAVEHAVLLAAPAPEPTEEEALEEAADQADAASGNPELDGYLTQLSESWAAWIRTRRFYCPPSLPPSILGRLRERMGKGGTGPNAIASAQLAAFNEAIEREPLDALDRQVFELHYRHRVSPVKTFADALGVTRRHWYKLLRSFEKRVYGSACEIEQRNEAERRGLRSTVGPV